MGRLFGMAVVCGLALLPLQSASRAIAGDAPVQMRAMTWIDIAAAVERGATTVIVPTGGIEQNGPHMALAKHDLIVSNAAERIAQAAGNTLVAPVVSFVPEGDFSPATANMLFPGTIGVTEPVFEGLLEDIARSLKHAGFRDIVFIGDHGMSQGGQQRVAAKLTREWVWSGVRVHHLDQYYDDRAQIAVLKAQGETPATIGQHASMIDTAELMSVDAASVDLAKLAVARGNLARVGGSGDPARASITQGTQLLKMRVNAAIAQLRNAVTR